MNFYLKHLCHFIRFCARLSSWFLTVRLLYVELFSVSGMSIDSKLLPLLDNSLEEIQTFHDILFSAKSSFSSAIMERPSCSNTKNVPRLFDGEKVLLTGIDRALLHAKNTAAVINAQRKDVIATVKSAERSLANYVTALQRLAKARNCSRPPPLRHPSFPDPLNAFRKIPT